MNQVLDKEQFIEKIETALEEVEMSPEIAETEAKNYWSELEAGKVLEFADIGAVSLADEQSVQVEELRTTQAFSEAASTSRVIRRGGEGVLTTADETSVRQLVRSGYTRQEAISVLTASTR
jgi:hypothetical protein